MLLEGGLGGRRRARVGQGVVDLQLELVQLDGRNFAVGLAVALLLCLAAPLLLLEDLSGLEDDFVQVGVQRVPWLLDLVHELHRLLLVRLVVAWIARDLGRLEWLWRHNFYGGHFGRRNFLWGRWVWVVVPW